MKQKQMQGYCFRCKTKRDMIDLVESKTANKRYLYVGKCTECSGRVSRMGGMVNENHDKRITNNE